MKLPREIYLLALISFMSSLGLGLVAPALPALATEFGVGVTAMSVAISGFAGARLLTNLGLTRLLRHVRLRPVLASGLAFQALTTIIAGLAQDYTLFIVFRCISGIGSAAFTIAALALLVALAPADRRGRAMGTYGGATGLGTVSGPAVGGVLALADPHLPLLVYGAALGLGSLVTVFLLRRARDLRTVDRLPEPDVADPTAVESEAGAVQRRRPGSLALLLRDPLFVTVIACQLVAGWVYYGLRLAILPAYLEGLGHSLVFVGALLAVSAGVQLGANTLGGALSDRLGRSRILLFALCCALLALALLGFAWIPVIAILAFVLNGIAGGSQASTASALLADSRGGRTALAAGVYWMAADLAAIVGPIVTGVILELAGPQWALASCAVVILVAMGFAIRSRRASAGPATAA